MWRWLSLFVFAAAALVPSMACVLVVPELKHDPHCGFTGTSACATCLTKSCQPSIDACCNDSACNGGDGHSSALDAIDSCAGGDQSGCASGLADGALNNGTSTSSSAMRTCVTTSCKDVCIGTAVAEINWTCSTAPSSDNACATCVYGMCAAPIATCCGSGSSCTYDSNIQGDIGRCVAGDAAGCAYLTTEDDSGVSGAVRGCIASKCGTQCFGNGRLHESCSPEGGGSYCACNHAAKSGGQECTAPAMGGICVLGKMGCTCGHYSCKTSTSGSSTDCGCSLHGMEGDSTECDVEHQTISTDPPEMRGFCCVSLDDTGISCGCDAGRTYECMKSLNEYPTKSCNLTDVLDVVSMIKVDSCSN